MRAKYTLCLESLGSIKETACRIEWNSVRITGNAEAEPLLLLIKRGHQTVAALNTYVEFCVSLLLSMCVGTKALFIFILYLFSINQLVYHLETILIHLHI